MLWFQVLAVFNLRDPQSQFGDWMSLFLQAAFMAEGIKNSDFNNDIPVIILGSIYLTNKEA